VNFDSSLLALLEGDFVGVWELVDLFIGGPELDLGVPGSSALKHVLSEEVLVVEGVEVRTFSLVWELGRVTNHIAIGVIPSVVVVSVNSFFAINSVYEYVVFSSSMFKVL